MQRELLSAVKAWRPSTQKERRSQDSERFPERILIILRRQSFADVCVRRCRRRTEDVVATTSDQLVVGPFTVGGGFLAGLCLRAPL